MTLCPYCGANVERNPGEVVLTCPYCGTAFTVEGGEVGEHLMGRINYSVQQVFENFKSWALRMPETPNDFLEKALFKSYEVRFYPFWVFVFQARVSYAGGYEDLTLPVHVPGHTSMLGTPLEKLRPTLGGKVFYSHRYVVNAGAKLVNPDVGPEDAEKKAVEQAGEMALESLSIRFGGRARLRVESLAVSERKLVHHPVIHATYTYSGREYKFMADASDSRILYAEIPVEAKFRAAAAAGGLASLGLALASLLAARDAPMFAVTSLLGFLVVAGVSLSKAFAPTAVVTKSFAS